MVTGSAPILPNVMKFMKVITSCPLIEAYGQTESTGGSFHTFATDP
jgi:long-subunit acyl-CoA synthetase (AMP-forming)